MILLGKALATKMHRNTILNILLNKIECKLNPHNWIFNSADYDKSIICSKCGASKLDVENLPCDRFVEEHLHANLTIKNGLTIVERF